MRARQIMADVATEHGLHPSDLTGTNKHLHVCIARHHAMYQVRTHTDLSLPEIGRLFARDHTTVLHGIRTHAHREGLPMPPTPKRQRRTPPRRCTVSGCRKVHSGRGLCGAHRARLNKFGDVLADVPLGEIPRGHRWVPHEACEVCGGETLGGSRWCAVGGCGQQRVSGRWSWSRSAA